MIHGRVTVDDDGGDTHEGPRECIELDGALDSFKETGCLPKDTSEWRCTFPALGFPEGPGLGDVWVVV